MSLFFIVRKPGTFGRLITEIQNAQISSFSIYSVFYDTGSVNRQPIIESSLVQISGFSIASLNNIQVVNVQSVTESSVAQISGFSIGSLNYVMNTNAQTTTESSKIQISSFAISSLGYA